MVTPQGFNALLKLVEEPPSHLRFIFATTEPDKVIGTIRSRTHHYPFRLVPPKILGDYLVDLCGREGVTHRADRRAADRARRRRLGARQPVGARPADGRCRARRRHLSAGDLAARLHAASLLDETVDALAADDGAALFGVIEKVVEHRAGPAPVRRGPAAPAARPRRRLGRARCRRPRPDRAVRRPGRAADRSGPAVRPRRAHPRCRHRQPGPDRHARRDRAAAAAGDHVRSHPAARRRRHGRGPRCPDRPGGASAVGRRRRRPRRQQVARRVSRPSVHHRSLRRPAVDQHPASPVTATPSRGQLQRPSRPRTTRDTSRPRAEPRQPQPRRRPPTRWWRTRPRARCRHPMPSQRPQLPAS